MRVLHVICGCLEKRVISSVGLCVALIIEYRIEYSPYCHTNTHTHTVNRSMTTNTHAMIACIARTLHVH